MSAFLKRRWLLLPCVVVLLACCVMNFAAGVFGAHEGNMLLMFPSRGFHWLSAHLPSLGKLPMIKRGEKLMIVLPIWLPLVPALGWLVIRELRWREKRARNAELP